MREGPIAANRNELAEQGSEGEVRHELPAVMAARPTGMAPPVPSRQASPADKAYPTNSHANRVENRPKPRTAASENPRKQLALSVIHVGAQNVLDEATFHLHAVEADLANHRLLTERSQNQPFVTRASEIAAVASEAIHGKDLGPLYLETPAELIRARRELASAITILHAVLKADDPVIAWDLYQQAERLAYGTMQGTLRDGMWIDKPGGVFRYRQTHDNIAQYRQRLEKGSEVAQSAIETTFLTVATFATGYGAATVVGGGWLSSLTAAAGATGAMTGVSRGAFEWMHQLNEGSFNPAAVAREALREAARTFVGAMLGGVLYQQFLKSLSRIDAENRLFPYLAGMLSGELVAALELAISGVDHNITVSELCDLLVTEAAKQGLIQTAVRLAARRRERMEMRRQEPSIVDRREDPHAPATDWDWILQRLEVRAYTARSPFPWRPRGESHQLLAPKVYDSNGVFYRDENYLPEVAKLANVRLKTNALYVSAHGLPYTIGPSNELTAQAVAKALLLLKDHPPVNMVLQACHQIDKRLFSRRSNAQVFQDHLRTASDDVGMTGPLPRMYVNPLGENTWSNPVHGSVVPAQAASSPEAVANAANYAAKYAVISGRRWLNDGVDDLAENKIPLLIHAGLSAIPSLAKVLESHPELLLEAQRAIGSVVETSTEAPRERG